MNTDLVHAPWRKSSYSANQGSCVEVAPLTRMVGVRDTKDRARGHLAVPRTAWAAFVRSVTR